VSIDGAFITDKYGNQHRRKTSMGWEMLIRWKGNTTSWVKLSDVKDSHPIEVAEYAVANKIVEQPAFCVVGQTSLEETQPRHAIGSVHTSLGLNYPDLWLML
jgi:hypothetical protein